MPAMLFVISSVISLFYLPVLVSGDNEFIFPPYGGRDGVTVGDSNLVFRIGDTANLKWTTNNTAPISLIAYQGPRSPETGFYNATLIGLAPSCPAAMSGSDGHPLTPTVRFRCIPGTDRI